MGACTTTIKDDGFNCTGNPALSCQSTNSSGTIYYGCYTSDFGGTWAHSSFACYTSQNCIVSVALSGVTCKATVTTCSTPSERDSLICVQDGKIWDVDPVTGVTTCLEKPTDCNWTVSTIPRLRCLDVPASGSIVCKNGECSGLPYSMWWSELRIDSTSTWCGNISHVHTSDTSYTFGSQCDVEERCSDDKKCYSEGERSI